MPIDNLQFRSYQPSDQQALAAIYHSSRQNTFTWKNSKNFRLDDFVKDTKDELIFIALDQQQPLGFISLWVAGNFVHHLYLDPQYQHRGLGSKLLDHGLKYIARPAQLKCEKQNLRALNFYQRKGWQIIISPDTADYLLLQLD